MERYQALLDSTELTPTQKHEVIQALWAIVAVAIDLGLGVYPAQAVLAQRNRPDRNR